MAKYSKRNYKKTGKKIAKNKRWNIYGKAAGQMFNDVMYLKSIINSELHAHSGSFTALTMPSIGGVVHLSAVGQGDTVNTRSGNSILSKYLNVNFCISQNNLLLTDSVRVIFVIWKKNTTPTITDILETSSPWSHYNRQNVRGDVRDRDCVILSDRTYTLIQGTEKQCVNTTVDLRMNSPGVKNPLHMIFNGASTTGERNGLFMLYVGTLALNFSLMDGKYMFKFYDN